MLIGIGLWSAASKAPEEACSGTADDKDGATTPSRCGCRGRSRPATRSTSSARRTSRCRASTRRSPARAAWAATSGSGRRRRKTARTSSTSTSTRSPTTPTLDTPERRDEIARITNGYSPAMIDQICSMALTNAHHEGRAYFDVGAPRRRDDRDRVGHAVNVKYHEDDARAIAIHEAGHAAAAHVYRPDLESSRLSIRMRGRVARPPPVVREGRAVRRVPEHACSAS